MNSVSGDDPDYLGYNTAMLMKHRDGGWWHICETPLQVGGLRDQRAGVAPNTGPVVHLLSSGEAAERLRELSHGDCLREQPNLQDLSFPG